MRGAALATLVSQAAVTTVYVYLLFFRTHAHVRFDLGNFRWDASILARIFAIGAPASVSFLVMALSGAIFNRMLVALSPAAVGGFQIGTRIDHVVILPLVSISTGLVTLVGMFHGAGRDDLLRSIVGYAMRQALTIGVVIGALFFVFAPWLVGVFTPEPAIREHGTSYLRTIVWSYPVIGFSILAGRAFQGLGRGVPELLLTALRLLISAPLAYLSVFVFGQPIGWIWLAPVVAAWVSGAVALGWLHRGLRGASSTAPAAVTIERA